MTGADTEVVATVPEIKGSDMMAEAWESSNFLESFKSFA